MEQRILIYYTFNSESSHGKFYKDISNKFTDSVNEISLGKNDLIALLKEDYTDNFNENNIKRFDYNNKSWYRPEDTITVIFFISFLN